jgi:cell wall-associated NlpC family hydrolase
LASILRGDRRSSLRKTAGPEREAARPVACTVARPTATALANGRLHHPDGIARNFKVRVVKELSGRERSRGRHAVPDRSRAQQANYTMTAWRWTGVKSALPRPTTLGLAFSATPRSMITT